MPGIAVSGTQSVSARILLYKVRGYTPAESVASPTEDAKAADVRAEFVDIGIYNTVMLRPWRKLPSHPDGLGAMAPKGRVETVRVSVPAPKGSKPGGDCRSQAKAGKERGRNS